MVIYKTTNLVNGKFYVGKDINNNPLYLGSGLLISQAIKKYGKENFKKEIVETCSSLSHLNERETHWIKTLDATNRKIAYNLTLGGDGGPTWMFSPRRDELLKQFREASLKFVKSEKGKEILSKNTRRVWKNSNHRKRIVDALTGREIKWKDKISKSITEWHKTNPISDETRQRINEINRRKMTGRELKIISDEIIQQIMKLYDTIGPKRISKQLGISPYLVIRVLKKKGIYQKWKKGLTSQKNDVE